MFSSIGWPEIIVIVLLGIVIIGPERMPEVIKDVRAAIYAARKAINNAKAELNGEMGSISAEFDDIRGPLNQAAQWTRLGPKGAVTGQFHPRPSRSPASDSGHQNVLAVSAKGGYSFHLTPGPSARVK